MLRKPHAVQDFMVVYVEGNMAPQNLTQIQYLVVKFAILRQIIVEDCHSSWYRPHLITKVMFQLSWSDAPILQ